MGIGTQARLLAAAFAAAAAVVVVAAVVAGPRVQVAVTGLSLLGALALVGLTAVRAERRSRAAVGTAEKRLRRELSAVAAPALDEDRLLEAVVDRVDRLVRREYTQLEELLALYHEVAPGRALPAMRGWAASPDYQRALFSLIREHRPTTVVECGSGSTTLIAARALQLNGHGRLVSLEHMAEHAQTTRGHLHAAGLTDVAEVVHAPLVDHDIGGEAWRWYDLATAGELRDVGLVIVDGPPRKVGPLARYPALPLLAGAMTPDARLLLDDADRPEELDTVRRWEAEQPGLSWTRLAHEKGTVLVQRRAADSG